MYETYCDTNQQQFRENSIHLNYIDTKSFVLSVKTIDINKDFQNRNDLFDFSNLKKTMKHSVRKT